ncbi:AraC family transcriptional regulator [Streptomyces caelestis]|uniref:AraC-like DNA-binding protein n=1 Tax=Streptomyces caelestis TaxID=36816 RepID=A0A7W9HDQ2_9ACTN|nr:AraC family transcriptional regulator [Streptomyces caelestis]MBB5800106.1 AraC-like DNA-binding protein [Streptomyces caelestis]GGW86588.1 AraC family transcriptional regulator [Streptomyces caelestis]
MDVVSDVIATMRGGRPKFTHSYRDGEWGNRFGPYPGAGFHIVLRGGCWLLPSDGDAIRLSAGDVVFLPHGAMHGMGSDPGVMPALLPPDPVPERADLSGAHSSRTDQAMSGTVLLCGAYRLDRGQVHPFLHALPQVIHIPARPGMNPALRATVDLLGADLADAGPGTDAALPALLDLLLVYVLRAWLREETSRNPTAGWCAALTDPAVAAALNHIHRRTGYPWTVQKLAHHVGMSRTAFARRFTRTVGQAPMAYMTWWRLSTAARMLRDGDDPLATVAQQIGYTSEFAFANAFKRAYGVAPGRYRRAQREPQPTGAG